MTLKEKQTVLNEQQANDLLERMEANAAPMPILKLTAENWYAQFGEDGMIDTPIGQVKMGETHLFVSFLIKVKIFSFLCIRIEKNKTIKIIKKYLWKKKW